MKEIVTPRIYERRLILGVPFDVVSLDDAVEHIRDSCLNNGYCRIVTGNVDYVVMANQDEEFRKNISMSNLVVADGVPILWAARLLGSPLKGRVNGTDLVWKCAQISAEIGSTVALIGGKYENTSKAAQVLMKKNPGSQIQAINTPFSMTEIDVEDLIEKIHQMNAAIVLVGLGAPLQDRWIQKYLKATGANVGIGIGGAFEIVCGSKRRAPKWMQKMGLEWFFRMMQEPVRLGKRYLFTDSKFFLYLLTELCKKKFHVTMYDYKE